MGLGLYLAAAPTPAPLRVDVFVGELVHEVFRTADVLVVVAVVAFERRAGVPPLLFEHSQVLVELLLPVADLQELQADLVQVLAQRLEYRELYVFQVLAQVREELVFAHFVDLAVQVFVGVAVLEQVLHRLDELLDDHGRVSHERAADLAEPFRLLLFDRGARRRD